MGGGAIIGPGAMGGGAIIGPGAMGEGAIIDPGVMGGGAIIGPGAMGGGAIIASSSIMGEPRELMMTISAEERLVESITLGLTRVSRPTPMRASSSARGEPFALGSLL
jgi:hypothetical protein